MKKMKIKIIHASDLVNMDHQMYNMFIACLRYGTLRLIGVPWKKHYMISQDYQGNVIIQYE